MTRLTNMSAPILPTSTSFLSFRFFLNHNHNYKPKPTLKPSLFPSPLSRPLAKPAPGPTTSNKSKLGQRNKPNFSSRVPRRAQLPGKKGKGSSGGVAISSPTPVCSPSPPSLSPPLTPPSPPLLSDLSRPSPPCLFPPPPLLPPRKLFFSCLSYSPF